MKQFIQEIPSKLPSVIHDNFHSFKQIRGDLKHGPSQQGCSSTKIVWGPRSWKNAGHHGWPTEKILGFEWPKMT